VIWNRPGEQRIGSMGKAGDAITVRLLDADGSETREGELGEIWVQAPHLMIGYWQDPEATASACHGDWYRTGDLARLDSDGYIWFAGRRKEMIVRGGSNISPQEVEAVFYEHPAVAEAAVVGEADDLWGEAVVAHVVLRPGKYAPESEILEFVRTRLADYKVPARVMFHAELPRSPSGKIQRRFLREQSASPARRVNL
jgi:long-chain acyl-CoA synthetase